MSAAYLRAQSHAPAQFCSKIAFETRLTARKRMSNSRKVMFALASSGNTTAGLRSNVYQCKACNLWHIGHVK